MTRQELLSQAGKLVTEDRQEQYGDNREMHERVSVMWSALANHPISPELVTIMLAGLKLCRIAHNPAHADSWVDACGYIALGAELAVVK